MAIFKNAFFFSLPVKEFMTQFCQIWWCHRLIAFWGMWISLWQVFKKSWCTRHQAVRWPCDSSVMVEANIGWPILDEAQKFVFKICLVGQLK